MKLNLPEIFQDHMVLQRNRPLHILGKAAGCSSIHGVLANSDTLLAEGTCPVAENGCFDLLLLVPEADWDVTLSLYGDDQTEPERILADLLIGDVYVAGGQSNMEYYLRYDADWVYTQQLAFDGGIRMFNVPRLAFDGQERPNQEGITGWFCEQDPAWAVFSAPAYSFARELRDDVEIPIGVIGCNWGGTPACSWVPEAMLQEGPLPVFLEEYERETARLTPEENYRLSMQSWAEEDDYHSMLEWRTMMYGLTPAEQQEWLRVHNNQTLRPMGPWNQNRPSGLYHTMMEKLSGLSAAGVLWYQGCSDQFHADLYDRSMEAVIASYRKLLGDDTLPFFFVQLAPFGTWLGCTNENYGLLRAKQDLVRKTIPGAYMASIMDIGDYDDIHPKQKMEVGRRLSLLAKRHIYHLDLECEGPQCIAAVRCENTLILTFSHAEEGLIFDDEPENGFLLLSGGKELEIKELTVHGQQVLIQPETLPDAPIEIRFAWADYAESHLWNNADLSALPFCITV